MKENEFLRVPPTSWTVCGQHVCICVGGAHRLVLDPGLLLSLPGSGPTVCFTPTHTHTHSSGPAINVSRALSQSHAGHAFEFTGTSVSPVALAGCMPHPWALVCSFTCLCVCVRGCHHQKHQKKHKLLRSDRVFLGSLPIEAFTYSQPRLRKNTQRHTHTDHRVFVCVCVQQLAADNV